MLLNDQSSHQRTADAALVDLVTRANRYLHQLTKGKGRSLSDVAQRNAVDISDVSRVLPFAFMSPKLLDSILSGSQPVTLAAQRLLRIELPLTWDEQQPQLADYPYPLKISPL